MELEFFEVVGATFFSLLDILALIALIFGIAGGLIFADDKINKKKWTFGLIVIGAILFGLVPTFIYIVLKYGFI